VQLSKLGPDHVQRLQDSLLAKQLSPTSVHQAHSVLHRALADAMRWGRLSRNVAELVRPPRMSPSHMTTVPKHCAIVSIAQRAAPNGPGSPGALRFR